MQAAWQSTSPGVHFPKHICSGVGDTLGVGAEVAAAVALGVAEPWGTAWTATAKRPERTTELEILMLRAWWMSSKIRIKKSRSDGQ